MHSATSKKLLMKGVFTCLIAAGVVALSSLPAFAAAGPPVPPATWQKVGGTTAPPPMPATMSCSKTITTRTFQGIVLEPITLQYYIGGGGGGGAGGSCCPGAGGGGPGGKGSATVLSVNSMAVATAAGGSAGPVPAIGCGCCGPLTPGGNGVAQSGTVSLVTGDVVEIILGEGGGGGGGGRGGEGGGCCEYGGNGGVGAGYGRGGAVGAGAWNMGSIQGQGTGASGNGGIDGGLSSGSFESEGGTGNRAPRFQPQFGTGGAGLGGKTVGVIGTGGGMGRNGGLGGGGGGGGGRGAAIITYTASACFL